VTAPAAAVKAVEEEPAATVTEAGIVSTALLSESAMVTPPVGAGLESETVHVEAPPEGIVAGEHCSADSVGGGAEMESEAVADLPSSEAVMVAD
jgi:hypothetical protein